MIDWNFPLNNDGKEDGLNDPGIETFRDDPLRALAREINQNSSDAADKDTKKPVEVHFDLLEVPIKKFPAVDNFRKTLSACERFWRHSAAARKFFVRAKDVMKQNTLWILRISDYNTTGLVGADGGHNADWFKLTKSVGASDKEGGAGGSFGIGKHAPFASSDIRTIFYGTKDNTGKVAFQGVARLVTHELRGKTTQGTGYYGVVTRNGPITKLSEIPPLFRRKQTGTDIFVAGFHHQHRNWSEDIIKSVLENFFVAIHEGRLIVKVGEIHLNQNTVADHIRRYAKTDSEFHANAYYDALTSEEAHLFVDEDFAGLGRLELRILAGKDYPRRIAMVRSTGMKIYDKGHFQTPVRFAGVLTAKGQKLNEVLRSMEPPSHNDWQPERHEDPEYAKGLRRSLYGWMNDCVRKLSAENQVEELDAEGLSQYLPDDSDDTAASDDTAEGTKGDPRPEVEVQIRAIDEYTARTPDIGAPEPSDEDESMANGGGDGGSGGGGGGSGGGGGGGSGGGGSANPKEKTPIVGTRRVGLRDLRVYCADAAVGRYRLLFEPESSGTGHLVVKVVGEIGEELAPIVNVRMPDGASPEEMTGQGHVGPMRFEKGKRTSIEIVLQDALHCALGVSAYAD